MIQEKDVNDAFDALEKAFQDLAALEDKQSKIVRDMEQFKDGSQKKDELQRKLQKLQPEMTDLQRAYRLAGMRADRIRLLLDVQKTAMGRD